MDKSGYPSVTITFDGMMLFHFDGNNRRCEVMFRDAHDHKIEVIAKKYKDGCSEDLIMSELTHDNLSGYDYLWLYVENHGETRNYKLPGNAGQGDWYKSILQLDGGDFYYNTRLELKSGKYKPTMYVCDGKVGADNSKDKGRADNDKDNDKDNNERGGLSRVDSKSGKSTCYRVEEKQGVFSFSALKYNLKPNEWDALKDKYSAFIKPLNPFLRWVNTTINLTSGQNLMLVGERDDGTIRPFKPLITNYHESDAYWIHIKYTDSVTPNSLGDCKGVGRHCEAFERNGSPLYPLYSVFSPKNGLVNIPTAPWEPEIRSSDVPCCLSACVNQYVR